MNNPRNESWQKKERRMLPFFIEFVKFSTGFAVIIATALLMLNVATTAM